MCIGYVIETNSFCIWTSVNNGYVDINQLSVCLNVYHGALFGGLSAPHIKGYYCMGGPHIKGYCMGGPHIKGYCMGESSPVNVAIQ